MAAPTFSPDGQWMWNGNEWIPAPPKSSPVETTADIETHSEVLHDDKNKSGRISSTPKEDLSDNDNFNLNLRFAFLSLIWFFFAYLIAGGLSSVISDIVYQITGEETFDLFGEIELPYGIALLSLLISLLPYLVNLILIPFFLLCIVYVLIQGQSADLSKGKISKAVDLICTAGFYLGTLASAIGFVMNGLFLGFTMFFWLGIRIIKTKNFNDTKQILVNQEEEVSDNVLQNLSDVQTSLPMPSAPPTQTPPPMPSAPPTPQTSQVVNHSRRRLFDLITQRGFNIGEFEFFNDKMQTEEGRRLFYAHATANNMPIGTWEDFEQKMK